MTVNTIPGTGPVNGGGGFSARWATQTGVVYTQPEEGSPSIYKYNSGGGEDFSTLFPSIDGSEFEITFDAGTNTLSFIYNAGAGDPEIHYFSVKQSNAYVLFYDADPITSGSVNMTTYYPRQPGFSHITFYDTGAIPEPAVWAMMLFGFGAVGAAMRRRRGKPAAQFA